MDKTDPKININSAQFREFLAEDAEGNSVVLRSNAPQHQVKNASFASETASVGSSAPNFTGRSSGSLRFFCDVKTVASQWRNQG